MYTLVSDRVEYFRKQLQDGRHTALNRAKPSSGFNEWDCANFAHKVHAILQPALPLKKRSTQPTYYFLESSSLNCQKDRVGWIVATSFKTMFEGLADNTIIGDAIAPEMWAPWNLTGTMCNPQVKGRSKRKAAYMDIADIPSVEDDQEVAELLDLQIQMLDQRREDTFRDVIMRLHRQATSTVALHSAHIDAVACAEDAAEARAQEARFHGGVVNMCVLQARTTDAAAIEAAGLLHSLLTDMTSFITGSSTASSSSSTSASSSATSIQLLVSRLHGQAMHRRAAQVLNAMCVTAAQDTASASQCALQAAQQHVEVCVMQASESQHTSAAVALALHKVLTLMDGFSK